MKMSSIERQAVFSLSSIMALRMIGLFMVLPVFTLYAQGLIGATPTLIGLAIGIYGLAQAVFQIPFGALSDRFGRKPVILLGLLIFTLGSVLCGMAHSIGWMILGRTLQGTGAVGSTILAMMADLTHEDQRTKAMAIAGVTIGFSFMLAILLGPVLMQWFSVNGLFYIAALMGVVTIVMLFTVVPGDGVVLNRWMDPRLRGDDSLRGDDKIFLNLLLTPALARLNSGIFFLHAIFTASFVVIPISLHRFAGLGAHEQWHLYVPALLIAFICSLTFIGIAERKKQVKPFFIGGIFVMLLSQVFFWATQTHLYLASAGLCLFLTGFSMLEAFLPSLISRTAPPERKGSAMGIYSCAQFSGIFVGGALGGWLYGQFSFTGVYLFCIFLTLCWLLIARNMQPPRYKSEQASKNPDFNPVKEHLQSE